MKNMKHRKINKLIRTACTVALLGLSLAGCKKPSSNNVNPNTGNTVKSGTYYNGWYTVINDTGAIWLNLDSNNAWKLKAPSGKLIHDTLESWSTDSLVFDSTYIDPVHPGIKVYHGAKGRWYPEIPSGIASQYGLISNGSGGYQVIPLGFYIISEKQDSLFITTYNKDPAANSYYPFPSSLLGTKI